MILDTPEFRQGDDWDCGAAFLEILFGFHGVTRPRWVKKLANPVEGMQPDTIAAAIWAVFDRPAIYGPMTIPILRGFLADGKPVGCPVIFPGDDEGHWVCVRGIERGRVHLQDPSRGRISRTFADWLAMWKDAEGSVYQQWGVTGWPSE